MLKSFFRIASWTYAPLVGILLLAPSAEAAIFYATGQRLTPAVPDVHDDIRENFLFAVDSTTGIATPVSPETSGLPAALAGTPDQQLLGYQFSGQLVEIDRDSATQTPIAEPTDLGATSFDILENGRGFVVPFDESFNTQQLHQIDVTTGSAIPLGSSQAVGDAIDQARGTELGTAAPFVISLGSVENSLYGIDLDTESLIQFDPETGDAAVIGEVGAVTAEDRAVFSGFAALTGVDSDADGQFDALFGNVNFVDDDNDPETPVQRLGGIARYDLSDGSWDLVGTNPGVIFFGFGASPAAVPEPATLGGLLLIGGLLGLRRRSH
ncbi:MAG: PEP-CTERM sorting domain-containing protein [Leptolyngbya sp. SIO1E4]|nr:PEP-CTERM sorting domain-containing protein [Leptolyngbya sp. SIO1E4]